jgi:hypothetical protein
VGKLRKRESWRDAKEQGRDLVHCELLLVLPPSDGLVAAQSLQYIPRNGRNRRTGTEDFHEGNASCFRAPHLSDD